MYCLTVIRVNIVMYASMFAHGCITDTYSFHSIVSVSASVSIDILHGHSSSSSSSLLLLPFIDGSDVTTQHQTIQTPR